MLDLTDSIAELVRVVRLLLVVYGLLLPLSVQAGESWSQFRGPDGQGHSDARDLPVAWSETENIAWKTPIDGRGWSSPVIEGNLIWLTTALDDGHSLRAVCVDRAKGNVIHDVNVFDVDAPAKVNAKNSYASPTPVLQGNRLWVHFGTYGTACLDSRTGRILWTNRELKLDHQEGPGSSPILYKNLLIVHCDGIDVQYIVALDKQSGRPIWKTERSAPDHPQPDQRKAYSTPLVIEVNGQPVLLSVGAQRVYAYDPDTGSEIWYAEFEGFSNVPRPSFADGLAIIATGYMKPQLLALRPDGHGNVSQTHVAWHSQGQVPANPSLIVVGKELFMVSDAGVLSCLDVATGKERFKSRVGGNFSASPIAADGQVYFFSEDGETIVIKAAPKLQEIARNKLNGRIMASPAVAGRAIYLRTDRYLYRIEQGGGAAALR